MRTESRWHLTAAQAEEVFDEQQAKGRSVISLSMCGRAEEPLFAFVWKVEPGPRQFFMRHQTQDDLEYWVEKIGRENNMYPAYISAFGSVVGGSASDDVRFAVVFEERLMGDAAPVLIRPYRWLGRSPETRDGFTEFLAAHRETHVLRSVGVIGVPNENDLRAAHAEIVLPSAVVAPTPSSYPGLLFVGTLWPTRARSFAWSARLTPNLVNAQLEKEQPHEATATGFRLTPGLWRDRWETQAISLDAHPVFIQRTRESPTLGSLTVSIWHGVRYAKWKDPPLSKRNEFRSFAASDTTMLGHILDLHVNEDLRPISIGAVATGQSDFRYDMILGRKGDESPLPRRWLRRGPGAPRGERVSLELARAGRHVSDPIEHLIRDAMMRSGARHGQVVVVRDGELKYAAAFTWAEDGYPVCNLDHAIRIGSVSKHMTALIAYRGLVDGLAAGADTLITDESLLGLPLANHQAKDYLSEVTLRQLLEHNAGWWTGTESAPTYVINEPDCIAAVLGVPPGTLPKTILAGPGYIRAWLGQNRENFYYRAPPGTPGDNRYSNESFIAAAAAISRGIYDDSRRYGEASRALLAASGVAVSEEIGAHFAPGVAGAQVRGESPPHARVPAATWSRTWSPENEEPEMSSAPFGWSRDWISGAGAWCVPLVWIAHIIRALAVGSPPLLTRAQLVDLGRLTVDGVGAWNLPASGSFRRDRTYTYFNRVAPGIGAPPSEAFDMFGLFHNGLIDGGSATYGYYVPKASTAAAARRSLGVCAAVNTESDIAFLQEQLVDAVQAMEATRSWPAGDLFDAL